MEPEDWKRRREARTGKTPRERQTEALEEIADEMIRLREQMMRIEVALAKPR